MPMVELLVKTANPAALDQTLQPLGGLVCQGPEGTYTPVAPGLYAVRVLTGSIAFWRWAITRQGYGEVVGTRALIPAPLWEGCPTDSEPPGVPTTPSKEHPDASSA